ncbi:MAG TPA: signal recognition particle protein, partial [bacterium]|nr:signal recognition particle protein [bacterium]
LQSKLKKREFDLEDFRAQLGQMKKIGSLEQIIGMLPGLGKLKELKNLKPDEGELDKIEAIINSMTRDERRNHKIINGSRRKRIAKGSGTSIQDVNLLLKNFTQTKKMMEDITRKGLQRLPSLFH